jgi:hypothetical protein
MATHHIDSVRFLENGGVVISYATLPGDSRANTALMMAHQLAIDPIENYRDEIEAVRQAAQELLEDVLEDWAQLPADDPALILQKHSDDDDEGMGSG